MKMDFNIEILKWGAYLAVGIMGWFLRVVWTAQEIMRKDFNELEKNLPLAYVPRSQFKEIVDDLKEALQDSVHPLFAKLDRMEEKMERMNEKYLEQTLREKGK
jgi:CO dehydrogenase/acetyl-CoA synthase beta subunit